MLWDEDEDRLELRDYVRVLRRHRVLIALVVAATVGLSLLASYLQTPVYSGTARLLIEPRSGTSLFESTNGQASQSAQFITTEIEVIKGASVQQEVHQRLGSIPSISVKGIGSTSVVRLTAESTDPKRAADVANAYMDAYIAIRRQQGIDKSLMAQKEVQGQIDVLQGRIDGLDAQLATAQGSVADSLRAQRQSQLQQQALFKQTLDQQQVNMALITGGAQIVSPAAVPTAPISPLPRRNGVVAFMLGVLIGVGLAFLVEHLDDSIETQEELERVTGAVPVVGLIPEVVGWKVREKSRLVAAEAPRSPPAEAYRALRTAIDFIGLDHPMRTLQVTSPSAGEGKTTTLANLGVTLALAGKRVVIVCCDLRRPRVHEFFGLSNTVGFTSALIGERPVSAALQAVPGVPRLRLMASGPLPPNPSEVLSSQRAAGVFAALEVDTDIILIDSPPVLPVTDALVLFRHVDALLMVFSAGSTNRNEAISALAKVRQVNGPLVGAVLNGVKTEGGYGYAYGYQLAADTNREGAARRYTANGEAANSEGQSSNGRRSRKTRARP